MLFVYLMTVVVLASWVYRMIDEKRFIFNRTVLDVPLLLFLAANVLSTIFSIDQHISIWGYYSRSNGGLLSTISYLLLFWAFVSNMEKKDVPKVLIAALSSSAIISLYAIWEHFGVSPSCVILRGEFNVDCWVQRVQERVFATLGQPNWLAAYLSMLIFPALYFLLTSTQKVIRTIYYILATLLYMAFTFTYSRGGTLGLIGGLIVFLIFTIGTGKYLSLIPSSFFSNYLVKKLQLEKLRDFPASKGKLSKNIVLVLGLFLLVNALFGSAFIRFQLNNLLVKPTTPLSAAAPATSVGTQLENGGTESGQIRLIVWQGALDIFKKYPLFGSGVETFAYSYYQFRPISHNLTSEWDFLYNKAHNEFLNYLATTGIVGFAAYMAVIVTFIVWVLRKITQKVTPNYIFLSAILASYLAYLIQNLFGFSVVIIALFFFTFPALVFVESGSLSELKLPQLFTRQLLLISFLKRPIYSKLAKILTVAIALVTAFFIYQLWMADTLFALGQKYSNTGNAGRAYNLISDAVDKNPNEPFYRSELGYAAAQASVALEDGDATLSAQLKKQAVDETEKALTISPNNVSFWRTAIRTYYQLANIDPTFNQKTLEAVETAIKFAPTDPKLYYNKAIILGQLDKQTEAIESLEKALSLKPNYREGYLALALFYYDQASEKGKIVDEEKIKKAVENMGIILKLIPNDPEAMNYLNEWGKQGVATESGLSNF